MTTGVRRSPTFSIRLSIPLRKFCSLFQVTGFSLLIGRESFNRLGNSPLSVICWPSARCHAPMPSAPAPNTHVRPPGTTLRSHIPRAPHTRLVCDRPGFRLLQTSGGRGPPPRPPAPGGGGFGPRGGAGGWGARVETESKLEIPSCQVQCVKPSPFSR